MPFLTERMHIDFEGFVVSLEFEHGYFICF